MNVSSGTPWGVIPRELSNSIRKWLTTDLSEEETTNLVKSYNAKVESESFDLECPELDGSMVRILRRSDKYLQGQKFENTLESIQFKVLYMVRPILFLYTTATPDENDPIAKAVSAALKLWAVTFRDISKHCRRNVLARWIQSLLTYQKTPGTSHQENLLKRCLPTQLTRRKWKTLGNVDPDSFLVLGIFNQFGDTTKKAHRLTQSLRRTGRRILMPYLPEMGS